MKINIKKTKAMVVSKKPNSPKINIAIDGQQIEQVTYFMYLGSLITEEGRCEKKSVTLVTRKFGNIECNSHCGVLHITPVRVVRLVLDCNGVFAIKAY